MRAVVMRVKSASVEIDGAIHGAIENGFLVLLGVHKDDTMAQAEKIADKICGLRIFEDENGKMNVNPRDAGADLLIISQFTLFADTRRGNRPSFVGAARPEVAIPLYEGFCELAERDVRHVGRGVFGAEMQVTLTNDGPITIVIDTDELRRPKRS